ncbi:MAG: 16S rRNA (guanine(527)-N(7))-methyltransferase RsmG [Clostridia bacterium]|nr:16S rRNA (guanine(527)-N(7))-methyltransferase RsmG [Clostridia bacterium]
MTGRQIALHYPLDATAIRNFDLFHKTLYAWNAHMDLTAVPESEALERHYLDALTALPFLRDNERVIDVGTGAGFPGLPLLIARTTLRMTLLDARAKRAAFLAGALAQLEGVSAEVVHARAEELAKTRRGDYSAAISRAVAPLPILIEWLMPFLCIGGRCVLWKGTDIQKELVEAARVSPLLGGGPPRVQDVKVGKRAFSLVFIDKLAETAAQFPRKSGIALKRPL